ncbi:MAG TPA: 50S ribosomal protein L9 [Chloroflexia bacterium]|nr:50S ribosomal protein L9 [Chloroflexia bacterium]
MKVILTQNVPGVGEAGAIKEVADGYARNYLIPKKLAAPATRSSLKQAEAQAEAIVRKANKQRDSLQQTASALDGKTVRIRARVGSENRLYGSITPADVADAIGKQLNVTVDRRKVELAEAIHRTGTYTATADFGSGIVAQFQVEVAPEAAGAFGASAPAQSGAGASGADTGADAGGAEAEAGAGTPEGGAGTGDAASEEVAEQEAEANPT